MGDITLKFSGSVNGFYVHDDGEAPSATNSVVGGVATVGGNSSAIRNGLLPGFLKVEVMTNQGGWDVGAHFGMYPGINSVNYAAGGGANSPGNPPGQIGRASCRERVGQYGSISAGDVSLKKKKKQD